MAKDAKIQKAFRLSRQTVGLIEQYSREEGITQTETVERAVKLLCRQGHTPATQQDIAALTEIMKAGFVQVNESIKNQPIAALEQPRRSWWKRLIGD